jgi:hypothetical protein
MSGVAKNLDENSIRQRSEAATGEDGEKFRLLVEGFIPIALRDRLEGIFLVGYNSPHYFRDKEVHLVENLGIHVAFSVTRI